MNSEGSFACVIKTANGDQISVGTLEKYLFE